MKQIIVGVFLLFAVVSTAKAQSITINEEPTITRMMDIYANGNKARTADQMQGAFTARYPGVYSGWSQAAPYYRVRIGGFTSRNDATKFLGNIKKDYPDAYIVSDKVKTTELTTL
jgi:hypothetical protein